jgi:hypothetical protein
MRRLQVLAAMPPSLYRKYVKNWDKTRYAEVFKNKYRIYLPIRVKPKPVKSKVEPKVKSVLEKNGYTIDDYKKGLCKDKHNRIQKIGGVLTHLKENDLLKSFNEDKARSGATLNESMLGVISRHPYDIAGMSTDRGWKSCTGLRACDRGEHDRSFYIDTEIKAGSLIAYLIASNDKNITKPISRILIKPFDDIDAETTSYKIQKVYGYKVPEFVTAVNNWIKTNLKKLNSGNLAFLKPGVYDDSASDVVNNKVTNAAKNIIQKDPLNSYKKFNKVLHLRYALKEVIDEPEYQVNFSKSDFLKYLKSIPKKKLTFVLMELHWNKYTYRFIKPLVDTIDTDLLVEASIAENHMTVLKLSGRSLERRHVQKLKDVFRYKIRPLNLIKDFTIKYPEFFIDVIDLIIDNINQMESNLNIIEKATNEQIKVFVEWYVEKGRSILNPPSTRAERKLVDFLESKT